MRFLATILCLCFAVRGWAATIASDGTAQHIQSIIDLSTTVDGDIVTVPSGNLTWTAPINTRGKAVTIQGGGCNYYLGWAENPVSIGNGSKTFIIPSAPKLEGGRLGVFNQQTNTSLVGQTLRIVWKTDGRNAFMQGTVTSYSGQNLVMNITSSGNSSIVYKGVAASSAAHTGWAIRTVSAATTVNLIANSNTFTFITLKEATGGTAAIKGINFTYGNTGFYGRNIFIEATSNGKPVLIQDCSFLCTGLGGPRQWIEPNNPGRGVIARCSFDAGWLYFPMNDSPRVMWYEGNFQSDAWTAAEPASGYWGNADTTGSHKVYFDGCYFGGHRQLSDVQQGLRVAFRHCIWDNSSMTSHGAESDAGHSVRYVEFLDSTFVYDQANDANGYWSAPLTWVLYMRGGTYIVADSWLDRKFSNEWSTGPEYNHALRRAWDGGGLLGCPGAYPAAEAPCQGWNGTTYAPEPAYLWNNSGTGGTNPRFAVQDITEFARQCFGNLSAFYIETPAPPGTTSSRDVKVNTQKPGYVKYQYPHPLVSGFTNAMDTTPAYIIDQPTNTTAAVGSPVMFSVSAGGAQPISYVWQSNGVAIAGATVNSYQIASVVLAQSNWQYRVIVANAYGSITSSVAILTVTNIPANPPTITTHPQSLTRNVGESALFSVVASGPQPFTYQWQSNEVNISAATAATLSYSSVTIAQSNASYRVIVSNANGSVTSNPAILTVNVPSSGTHYVHATLGNDNNPGTISQPWRSCPGFDWWQGTATLAVGDVVYFNSTNTWTFDTAYPVRGAWEPNPGVTYIGDEWPTTASRAILKPTKRQEGGLIRMTSDHPTATTWIKGFELDGNGQTNNLIDINGRFYSLLTGATKRFENITAHGNRGNASLGDYRYGCIIGDQSHDQLGHVANVEFINITAYDCPRDIFAVYAGDDGDINNILLRNCEAYGAATDPSYSEGHGFTLKGPIRNVLLENCNAHDVKASAFFIDGPEFFGGARNYGPSNLVLRACIGRTLPTSDDGAYRFFTPIYTTSPTTNGNPGVMAMDVTIDSCLAVTNKLTGGLSMAGLIGTNINIRVYNNTFFQSRVDLGNPALFGTSTIDFRNNVIYQTNAIPFTDSGTDATTHAYNLYWTDTGIYASQGGSSKTTANILAWESTALTNNPVFIDSTLLPSGFTGTYPNLVPNAAGLSLDATSPGVDSGVFLGVQFATAFGSPRSVAGTPNDWDRGAWETNLVTIPTFPGGSTNAIRNPTLLLLP